MFIGIAALTFSSVLAFSKSFYWYYNTKKWFSANNNSLSSYSISYPVYPDTWQQDTGSRWTGCSKRCQSWAYWRVCKARGDNYWRSNGEEEGIQIPVLVLETFWAVFWDLSGISCLIWSDKSTIARIAIHYTLQNGTTSEGSYQSTKISISSQTTRLWCLF